MDTHHYLQDDFARRLIALGHEKREFEPVLYYNADGDCIEFIAEPGGYNAHRINSLLTVYYSIESGKLIGSRIKGVKQLIKQRPSVRIAFRDGRVKLDHFIVAGSTITGSECQGLKPSLELEYRRVVQDLARLAFDQELDAPELCEA